MKHTLKEIKENSKFADSPKERLKDLMTGMFVNPTLPNIMLGFALGATVTKAQQLLPYGVVFWSWIMWLLFVLVYMIGDEVAKAYSAIEQQVSDEDIAGIE